jgi:hypothetical protein
MTTEHKALFYAALAKSNPDTTPFTLNDYFSLGLESFIAAVAQGAWLEWIERIFRNVLKNDKPNRQDKERLNQYLNAKGEFENINVLYTCIRLNSPHFFSFFLRVGINPDRSFECDEDWSGIPKYRTTIREYARTNASMAIQKLLST